MSSIFLMSSVFLLAVQNVFYIPPVTTPPCDIVAVLLVLLYFTTLLTLLHFTTLLPVLYPATRRPVDTLLLFSLYYIYLHASSCTLLYYYSSYLALTSQFTTLSYLDYTSKFYLVPERRRQNLLLDTPIHIVYTHSINT